MAYLGTPPRSRVLSSADIDPGSVSLDDISFTDQPASMNISGNIDKHTMRLADQVVVNGDLDISDNLILSKISDDGNAIILTTDGSTRTIEGAGGSLEASTLTQTPNASLTGMTGTIGSAVTGSPAISLINVTQFQTRHHFLGTKTTNQTINNNTTNLVTWDVDVYSSWDGSKGLDLSNNYWICPETGFYWLYFMHRLSDGDDAGGGQIWNLTKNQTITAAAQSTVGNHLFGNLVDEDSSYISNASNGQVCQLSSGDIIRFYCTNNHGTSESIQAGSDGWYQTKFGGYILR